MISEPMIGTPQTAGELDNRLSIDPNDPRWPQAAQWEDGMEYMLEMVRVRQVSAGEFEVVDAKISGNASSQPAVGNDPVRQSPLRQLGSAGTSGKPNPALEAMLSANR